MTLDYGDKNNYRPIALVTAASKIFEICLLEILEMYLIAYDHQFGFKSKHSTDICIDVFLAKSIMKYYTEHGSPVFTCFLDASKAFDRINHWTLFRKMIDSKMHLIIVRIIMFLYQSLLVALNGARLHVIFFVFPMVCGKVVYFHQNY